MNRVRYIIILIVFLGGANLIAEPKLSIFMATDVGMIENGEDIVETTSRAELNNYLMIRNYFNVDYTEQLDEKNLISVGVGGLFWKDYNKEGEASTDRTIKFGPGVSHAMYKYSLLENLNIQFGFFPYKYNHAAKNLGEYLFRTEAYPTIVYTGGWSLMNSANYTTVGALLSWDIADGFFHQDFTLFMENFNSPIYDITPAYIATLNFMKGIKLGGAASCHRCFTPTPNTKDEVTKPFDYIENVPRTPQPAIVDYRVTNINQETGEPFDITASLTYTGTPNLDSLKNELSNNYPELADIPVASIGLKVEEVNQEEVVLGELFNGLVADLEEMDRTAFSTIDSTTIKQVSFDNTAIKLLSFFELDFRAMMGKDMNNFPAFNLYGEFALLGTKNYPIYYTSYGQRFVSMLGISIPIPFVFDQFSIEMEYLKNPNVESIRDIFDKLSIPPDASYRYETFDEDDFKWSIHASKKWGPAFTFFVQVANDHLRPQNGFGQPTFIPVTYKKDHWYWMTRVQWAY